MTDPTQPDTPITVQAHAAPIVISDATKSILMALFMGGCGYFVKSEVVLGVIAGASGAIAVAAYSLWHRLRTWGVLKRLAGFVDDSVAQIGKPK